MTSDDRVVELLEELVTWTRVGMYPAVSQILRSQFEEARPEERLGYELLDGTRPYQEIVDICRRSIPEARISTRTLGNWTAKWERLGLIKRDNKSIARVFSLRDFDLNVPNFADGDKDSPKE